MADYYDGDEHFLGNNSLFTYIGAIQEALPNIWGEWEYQEKWNRKVGEMAVLVVGFGGVVVVLGYWGFSL